MDYKQKLEVIEKEYNEKLLKIKQSEQDSTILFFELKKLRKFYQKKISQWENRIRERKTKTIKN